LTDSDRLVSDSWELLVKMGATGRLLEILRTEGRAGVAGRGLAEVADRTDSVCRPGRRFWRLTLTDSDGLVSGSVGSRLKFREV
jgi:hypothetical protein